MLKSIQISNFQSYKHTKLEFSDGVNVIVGPSDSGKTTIIRALRWLIWNRPSGEAFRSTWGGSTSVEININKNKIIRIKDQTGNDYFLDKSKFSAFGTDVPEEIRQVLNFNDINLQSQLDSPFLLTSSPGEVAKHFNQIAHLELIDIALKNIQRWVREKEQDVSSYRRQIGELNEQLKQFEHLEKFEVEVEVLELMQKDWLVLIQNQQSIRTLIEGIQEVDKQITDLQSILSLEKLTNIVLTNLNVVERLKDKIRLFTQFIDKIQQTKGKLATLAGFLSLEGRVNPILKLTKESKEIDEEMDSLAELIGDIEYTKQLKTHTEENLERLKEKFHKEMPSICPLCGQKILKK